ncbi:MFS transporter, partial [Alloalcanivorax gelatiniphagus]|uniref:MFS transporter n=1 Tax=Alloalcanivorax gelatiniphagus TaxID=1194167 RepID=UPI0036180B4E
MSPSSRTPGALRRSGPLLGFLVALMLLAANMRTGIVVLGPLADGIGEDLNLDAASLGLLTTLPLLCFAVLSLFAPRLGDRLGLERALLMVLWLLLAGLMARAFGFYWLMVGGTLVMGAAIAVMNVLTPGLVRQRFPHRVAAVTALYSVTMSCGASAAAALAVPVGDLFQGDWRWPLAASG